MTAVKARDVEAALRTRRDSVKILLFYGPDPGLVNERARAAAAGFVEAPADPFQLIRLDGDAVAETPGMLVEQATTYGLFGERRAIWLRPTSRNIAPSVSACLDAPLGDTLVVIEAGDLSRSAPIRTLCEGSDKALALPCYGDETRDLAQVVTDTLKAEGLAIERDARDLLLDALGGDRLATRGEIAKLALYCRGRTTVEAADVEAVVSDVSASRIHDALDAAFGGDPEAVDALLGHLFVTGTAAPAVLAAAIRHALQLAAAREAIDTGGGRDRALAAFRGLSPPRRDRVGRQASAWTETELAAALARLQGATLDTRQLPALAESITHTALAAIALRIRRRSGRAQTPA